MKSPYTIGRNSMTWNFLTGLIGMRRSKSPRPESKPDIKITVSEGRIVGPLNLKGDQAQAIIDKLLGRIPD